LLICGGLVFEFVSTRRLNPAGHASNLNEYLLWRPSANEFATIDVDGRRHVIAYGPSAGLLASGPSAYVFDDTGQLVDWSADIGDNPRFELRWKAQQLRGSLISRAQIQQFTATRSAN
jgi:hypothetical protein